MDTKVSFSAPARVDLSGGAADMFGFSTLSTAIDLRARVTIDEYSNGISIKIGDTEEKISREITFGTKTDIIKSIIQRFDLLKENFMITVDTSVPPSSGLGGSASITVAAIAALNKRFELGLNTYQIAEHAQRCESLEMEMRNGYQDWYAAAFGGTLFMDFKNKNNLEIDQEPFAVVENLTEYTDLQLVVAHTGVKHSSDLSNEKLYAKYKEGNGKVVTLIKKLDKLTRKARNTLIRDDLDLLIGIVDENQEIIREFNRSGKENEELIETALENGAAAAKVTGAGCGGCIAALCRTKRDKKKVAESLQECSSFVHSCSVDKGVQNEI
ncbi:MAG: hypothetical protein U9N35_03830 [Euryarchaeota archaeon]|nr:hypothetical protein [Euryarchaeota archaeon]